MRWRIPLTRIKDAGDSALLLELDAVVDPQINANAIAIAQSIRDRALAGVRDVVSTFRSVAVYFNPLVADVRAIRQALETAPALQAAIVTGRTHDVPVVYGGESGPDLAAVAEFAGCSAADVISRHAAVDYRVFMLGFLPGFAYLGTVAPEIAAPRRPMPRLKVPAGSVGIAGAQTAIYPRESPGGWQIIGRTDLRMFDAAQTFSPALFAPGDTIRFIPIAPRERRTGNGPATSMKPAAQVEPMRGGGDARTITVLRPGLFTTVQDSGRWGYQSVGVSPSGAMDPAAHRTANAVIGNDADAATVEVTLAGPELRLDTPATIAVSGADLSPTLNGAGVTLDTPTECPRGGVLRFGTRRHGTRAYVAFDGGLDVRSALGSRSTHPLTGIGGFEGRAVRAGDVLPLGRRRSMARIGRRRGASLPRSLNGGVRVRAMRGPQDDVFPEQAFDALQRNRFTISSQSDRMGFRLQGAHIPLLDRDSMISDATFPGAIQVPSSGEPVLLMADRQTTGGYPQIAVVITADLPLAAQLAPGDWIEFELCSRADALAALVSLEGQLLALG